MSLLTTRQIYLARRPDGEFQPSDLQMGTVELSPPAPEQLLVRLHWLSLDPMLRIFFNPASMNSAVAGLAVGAPVVAPVVAEVLESRSGAFAPGDRIEARAPWQDLAVLDAAACRKVSREAGEQTAVGVLGMPGFTAHVGLGLLTGFPPGGTLLISGAAGVVGGIAGQLARARGMRVVGIASGRERCAYLTAELRFDAALDRAAPDFADRLRAVAPHGVHAYFDNVGGELFAPVLSVMARGGAILICGLMAHYQGAQAGPSVGPDDRVATVLQAIMSRQLSIRAFSNRDHLDKFDNFMAEVGPLVARGQVRLPEIVHQGLESAPAAFAELLAGGRLGKHLVRLQPEAA